ncbi:hypothetical protein [Companilactobacillus kimchii]|uniref:hypothetical protein n=1 Tax=Companilactobacillus kimchii TaxID=2801452 RepID=UPI001CEDF37C|nr:hypothetical protein [Companilactobacillus kimchii]
MLSKYSDENKKIAMGFLSYISDLKDLNNLEQELQLYSEDETVSYIFGRVTWKIIQVS